MKRVGSALRLLVIFFEHALKIRLPRLPRVQVDGGIISVITVIA